MRRIVLLVHRVPISGEFTLNDLAGGAGRMDEVARAVSTAFTLSNDLRRDTEMTLLFAGGPDPALARQIRIAGARVRYLNPDERSTAALLKNALQRSAGLDHDFESSPGLVVGPVNAPEELERLVRRPGAIWLAEGGEPIRSIELSSEELIAVVSDPYDPSPGEVSILERCRIPRVSVGPRTLRSSQVIDLLHNELDVREAGRVSRS